LCGFGHHRGHDSKYLSIHKNPIEFRARYGSEAALSAIILTQKGIIEFFNSKRKF
jgi:hypothetical protein